jgi:glycosyltransferase involved in cell wall biosynthesis
VTSRGGSGSPQVLAWCAFQARTRALARALGGIERFVPGGRSRLPIRYLRAALATWVVLRRHRPALVVAISPPFLCPLIALAWCRLHRATLVIDCHTDAFQGPRWGWSQPIGRWLARRAHLVTLHTEEQREQVAGWGANALLLPDDVPGPEDAERRPDQDRVHATRPVVVVAGSLDDKEPVEAAVQAAVLLGDVEIRMTGDVRRVPAALVQSAPHNVVFTGWLDYPRFLGELLAADAVAAFSLDPYMMNRAAFEAVGLGRPLVLSDLPGLRGRFGDAARFCANEPEAMAAALREAVAEREEMAGRSAALREVLTAQRAEALEQVRSVVQPRRPRPRPKRMLMVSQHPYPQNPSLRRNVDYVLEQGWELDVVCTTDRPFPTVPPRPGLHLRRLHIPHRRSSALWYPLEYVLFFLRALPRVTWLSLRHPYRCVQVDNLPDFLVFIAAPGRLRGARVVFFLYELMPEMTMARLRRPAGHPLVRITTWLERRAVSWADTVITVNEPCRRRLLERGADGGKILVVPNTQPERTRSSPSLATPHPSLVTHATLIERYGVQVAIQALAHLRRQWPDMTLAVLGEGDHRPRLEQLAVDLGLGSAVEFTGFLPWDDAMARIRASTVGIVPVLPDGYGELLLPMKLLDYVAEGVPAACSRLPTIQEYFPADSVGYFEPGDAVELAGQLDLLLRDPDLRRLRARRAREALAALSWERVSSDYLAALDEAS